MLCPIIFRLDKIRKDLFYVHFMPPLGGIREMHVLKLFRIIKQVTFWCVIQLHQTSKTNFILNIITKL